MSNIFQDTDDVAISDQPYYKQDDLYRQLRLHIYRTINTLGQLGSSREQALVKTQLEQAHLWMAGLITDEKFLKKELYLQDQTTDVLCNKNEVASWSYTYGFINHAIDAAINSLKQLVKIGGYEFHKIAATQVYTHLMTARMYLVLCYAQWEGLENKQS